MSTSNAITLDHIHAFFSLDRQVEELDIKATATGGAGINNLEECPPPKSIVPPWRKIGTDYVKKYQEREQNEQLMPRRQTLDIPGGSTISINTLEDVEDASTAAGNLPAMNELQDESTKAIYDTYFKQETNYNSDFTITSYKDEILQQLEINPVIIIQGPTGCGKTTQVPQYILDHYKSRGAYCNIIVTQPRKIAAISISKRVCQERKWELGTIVGYQVAMDRKVCSDTRLSYVTTGVLLEKLVNSKRMDMYTHVIIDEVHERSQDTDFALLLVKKFLRTNSPRVKVILMSATFDSSSFSQYFNLGQRIGPAPVIDVIGKSKEVIEYYLYELKQVINKMPEFAMDYPKIDEDLYLSACRLISYFDIVEKKEQDTDLNEPYAPVRGAVLVFLPGYEEISKLSNELQARSYDKNLWVIPLHSSITVEEQTRVFQKPPHDHRKIIISTNIAESSITVPDVKYVIDFCLTKSLVTDPITNYTCLQLEWASKANCIQRKGRAGRTDIGKVYRLVPRQFYEKFFDYGIPEIKRCPLTSTILHLKKLDLCEPQEMLAFALDPPDLSDIGNAILQLKEALALTSRAGTPFDGDLTFVGRVMANLPLDIKLSKLIIFGYVFHCLEECIIIAASLSLQSFFSRPFHKALNAYKSKLAWNDETFSDCLTYLNAYREWKYLRQQGSFKRPGGETEEDWGKRHYIQIRGIKEVEKLVTEIKSRLEKLQIRTHTFKYTKDEKAILILKMVIAGAFFPHYYLQEPLDEKTVMRDVNDNDPHSTVHISGIPPKHGILYAASLRDMIKCCDDDNIAIEFEESKAYIKFNPSSKASNGILKPVYYAVKMRKLRMPMELDVYSKEEAERKYQQILNSKYDIRENKLISNRITVKPLFGVKKSNLPPPNYHTMKIFISHVNNCGSFYARYLNAKTNHCLRFLEMTINIDQGKNLEPLNGLPEVNNLYLAPFVEGQGRKEYYRALVQSISKKSNAAQVLFVDYGNVEMVNIQELRYINHLKTPDVGITAPLAIECALAEVKPFRSPSGLWSEKAVAWFKDVVNGAELDCLIYSVVQDKLRISLKKKRDDGIIIDINRQMIERGLAEPAEESIISKQNHELRMNSSSYGSDDREKIFDSTGNDVQLSWKEASECAGSQKTGRKVKLHGPYNPLEVSFTGLTNVDRNKCFKVERDSVNSVSFNPDPQDSYNAMLVSASVAVGQSTLDLIGRNTTLMPKIQGLPTLACLLFTPFAEIRTDKERNSYIGALCGLGYDSVTGESIYPDHDIELCFDIEMSLKDIGEINSIRMGFNLLLHSPSDILQYETAQARTVHDQTRTNLLHLLERRRKPLIPQGCKNPYRWKQVPVDFLLDTEVNENADHPDVFPLHKPPSLNKFQHQGMSDHLANLYTMVDGPSLSNDFKLIRCELCSVDVTSVRNLAVHLNSVDHQRKERKLKNC